MTGYASHDALLISHLACTASRVKRYKGMKKPTCHGGLGCKPCWQKYYGKTATIARQRRRGHRPGARK